MASVRTSALFVLALAGLAAPAAAGDLIVNDQGKVEPATAGAPNGFERSNWTLLEWNLDGIVYRIGDIPQNQTKASAKIREVLTDPSTTPEGLLKGRALVQRGDFADARAALDSVQRDAEALNWAKAEAAYLLAVSFSENPAEAEQRFQAFKGAFPKSKYVLDATQARARALLALGKVDDAKAEFVSLGRLPGLGDEAKVESEFWVTWIDEQVAIRKADPGAIAAVQKAYEALISKLQGKASLERILRRAQVGRASCLIALGKAAEAKQDLEKIRDTKDPGALAAIHNKLGTATWRANPSNKEELRAALKHYLRVVTLYGDEPGAEEDCAEAMFHAGELFRELKDQGQDWNARAIREWRDCIARFPGSEWARQAKGMLGSR